MFAKFYIFLVLITTALAASIAARYDNRILVDVHTSSILPKPLMLTLYTQVPKKGPLDTLKKLCKAFEEECKK